MNIKRQFLEGFNPIEPDIFFSIWCHDLDVIFRGVLQMSEDYLYLADTGLRETYRESFYDEGCTPDEAVDEEVSCWND